MWQWAIHPGNIFTNEIKVRVSDAVPQTVLNDIRSCSANDRDVVLDWAPPESSRCGEIIGKSDVWCLGFVLLQLMHCGTTCEDDTLKLLKDAMKKGTIPKNIQTVLEEGYSPQMVQLVLRMITPDANERISIEELHAHEYTQALLEFTDSKRKLRKKRMMRPLSECNLPSTGGLRAILNYLTDNIEHENCAAACLAWVAENACRAGADVPDLLPLHVWRAILVHNENSLVAEHALAILAHCTVVGKMHLEDAKSTASMGPNETTFLETLIDNSTFWNANTFQMIYDLIEKHASVDRVLGNGFALLDAVFCPPGHISFQRKVENAFWEKHAKLCQKLCEMGFVDLILGALRKVREGISELLRPALSVLWKLSVDRKNAKSFIEKGAFVAVYDAMKAYPQHIGVLNQAALCISALASETALTEEALTDLDVSALLLTMVENFLSYPDLCHNALLAMSTILHRSEKQALHFIHCVNMDNESKAIKCLDDIYRTHFDNLTIIEAVCSVADAMLSYDGIVEALVGELDKIKRLLKEIFNRFPVIHGIGDVCAGALRKIPAEYWQDEPISTRTSVTTDS